MFLSFLRFPPFFSNGYSCTELCFLVFPRPWDWAFLFDFYPRWVMLTGSSMQAKSCCNRKLAQCHFLLLSVNSHSVSACFWLSAITFRICQEFIVIITWKNWPNKIYSDISGSRTSLPFFLKLAFRTLHLFWS